MARLSRNLIAASLLGLAFASPAASATEPAERIVAVGGDVTEIIYALGAGGRVVAVDTTSQYPAAVRALPNVGYMRQLSAEPILALAPDHIIAIADAGPPGAIDVLRQAGVRFTGIEDEPSVDGALAKVRQVAAALGADPAGAALADAMAGRIRAVEAALPKTGRRPRTLFLLSVGRGALMAGGRGTSAAAIIHLAGGANVADAFDGYKPIEPEAMLARDPELIVVTDRTRDALGGVDRIAGLPLFVGTTAARTGCVVSFDGALLLGFGPRLPDAIEALAAALRPIAGEAR